MAENKKIWTFWEPKSNITPYIGLCMKTWTKFLPDYEVMLMDYDNLHNYLDKKTYDQIVFKKMSLAKQSDVIRAALLAKHGGIWLDADTIITKRDFIDSAKGNDVIMVGACRPGIERQFVYGAFIYTERPGTDFINEWFSKLPRRILIYRAFAKSKILRRIFRTRWEACEKWDYCENAIIDEMSVRYAPPQFLFLHKDDINALPEFLSPLAKEMQELLREGKKGGEGAAGRMQLYREFYFKPGCGKKIVQENGGIILLHNSWTEDNYRKMSEKEFLSQDILLADILRELLK